MTADPLHHSVSTAMPTGEQFQKLRTRLDKLGYFDLFTPESMSLIMRLLNDLVQTTDSCKKLKVNNDINVQERRRIENEVEPFKQEISHLTKENNQLHRDLIQAADLRDERDKKAQTAFRKYQNEIADLKFLNKQLVNRIEQEQHKADAERFRLENIMNLVGATVGKEIDSKITHLKFDVKLADQVQHMDIDKALEPMRPMEGLVGPDPHVGDLMKLAEAKSQHLEEVQKKMRLQVEELDTNISAMKEQIISRDQEIARLGSLLEVERGQNTGYHKYATNEEQIGEQNHYIKMSRIDQLESQVDYLNETVLELEKSKANVESEKAFIQNQAEKRAHELQAQLEEAGRRNRVLQVDLKKLEEHVNELDRSRRRTPRLNSKEAARSKKDGEIRIATSERPTIKSKTVTSETTELTQLKKAIEALNVQNRTLQMALTQAQEKLLRVRVSPKDTKDEHLQTDGEVGTNVQTETDASGQKANEADARPIESSESLTQKLTDLEIQLLKARTLSSTAQSKYQEAQRDLDKMNEQLKTLTEDKESLQITMNNLSKDNHDIRTERDDLIRNLNDFDSKLKSIQSEIVTISTERDRVKALYMQVNKELEMFRQNSDGDPQLLPKKNQDMGSIDIDTLGGYQTQEGSLENMSALTDRMAALDLQNENLKRELKDRQTTIQQMQGSIRVLENDKTDLVQTLEATTEKLSLKESDLHNALMEIDRLAALGESQTAKFGEQRELLAMLDRERDEWRHEIDLKTERIAEQDHMFSSQREQLSAMETEIQALRDDVQILQNNVNDRDHQINSLQRQIDDLAGDKAELEIQCRRYMDESNNLADDLRSMVKENQSLNKDLSDAHIEKDSIKESLEAQIRQLHYLEEVLEAKDCDKEQLMSNYRKIAQEHAEFENEIRHLRDIESNLKMELVVRDKQILHAQHLQEENEGIVQQLKIQLEAYEHQCTSLTTSLSQFEQELNTADMEKQQLNREIITVRDLLSQTQVTKEELHRQLALQANDGDRLRDNLIRLEKEKEALLSQIRTEKLKAERMELLVAEERIRFLQSEKSKDEYSATRRNLETTFKQLSEEKTRHSASLATLSSDLIRMEEENRALRERNIILEQSIGDNSRALAKADEDRVDLKLELATRESVATTADLKLHSVDVSPVVSSPARSALEEKIDSELVEAKRQLQRYEELYVKRQELAKKSENLLTTPRAPSVSSSRIAQPSLTTGTYSHRSPLSPSSSVSRQHAPTMTPTVVDNKSVVSTTMYESDESNVAQELVRRWKEQNDAIRRELESASLPGSLNSLQDLSKAVDQLAAPKIQIAQASTRTLAGGERNVTVFTNDTSNDDYFRKSLNESERRRRQVEEENEKLIAVMSQVSADLKSAKSPAPSRAST